MDKVINGAFGLFDYSVALGALGAFALAMLFLFLNERKTNKTLIRDMSLMHAAHHKEIKDMQRSHLESNANISQQTTMAFDRVYTLLEIIRETFRMRAG